MGGSDYGGCGRSEDGRDLYIPRQYNLVGVFVVASVSSSGSISSHRSAGRMSLVVQHCTQYR